jgi:hypothetical protein
VEAFRKCSSEAGHVEAGALAAPPITDTKSPHKILVAADAQ